MSEAIKGQDELKLAVEKLEAELFRDWPKKSTDHEGIGFVIDRSYTITIINCRVINAPTGGRGIK